MDPKRLMLAGAAGGALFVGGIVAGATTLAPLVANAATASPAASPATGAPGSGSPPAGAPANMPAHGSPEHENAETPVTGADATKAQAAAVKALGGGTAGAVTTDFTKNGYEVTVTKSDGTQVEVHLDGNFNVLQGGPHGG